MTFDKVGKQNTVETLKIALKAAEEKGINTLVVSSCSGYTIDELLALGGDKYNIVCVTHVNGFKEPGEQEMTKEKRAELIAKGVEVCTTTHVLSGAERNLSRKYGGAYPIEMIAHALRMLGQGMKVCVEIAVMALDCGLIDYMKPVIVIGGTGTGVDTAVVLRAAHASNLLDTRIDEVLCKPALA